VAQHRSATPIWPTAPSAPGSTTPSPTLPEGVEVSVTQDIWSLLGAQLEMILKNAGAGLLLVGLILLLFLNGRVGWWVMVGIPVSFLLALALFHLVFGQGISIIALIGFVMALGIVVDDAIVVGEDATTLYQRRRQPCGSRHGQRPPHVGASGHIVADHPGGVHAPGAHRRPSGRR
jgi:Cu/Ag efflux pump CusA